jgi:hypothetical protein
MQRLLLIASMAGLLFTTTGCLHRNLRSGQCSSCNQCSQGGGSQKGLLGKLGGSHQQGRPVPFGCQPGPLGWQQGGTNYPTQVNTGWGFHPQAGGPQGRMAGRQGAMAGRQGGMGGPQGAMGGPQGGTVGYPYYTTRGPRDFLLDNPPSIGR